MKGLALFLVVWVVGVSSQDTPDSRWNGGRPFGGGIHRPGGLLGGINRPGILGGNRPGLLGGHRPGLLGGNRPGFLGGALGTNALGYGNVGGSSNCRYWCKTPVGSFYCCESGNRIPGPVGVKPGRCPPVRPECPHTRRGPTTCSNDGGCPHVDKCCYDTCLQEHVCKPPLGHY